MYPRLIELESAALGRTMPVVRVGESGPPLIYVPSSAGDESEFFRYGMEKDCAPWIDSGRVRIFSVDGYGPHGLFNDALPAHERMSAYARFERFCGDELIPWILEQCDDTHVGVVGSSYGAFVAANLLFKRPERVRFAGGLGGVYAHPHRLDGYHDDDVYFHTPLEYLPRLEDPAILGAIRATRGIALYGATNDEWLHSTIALGTVLRGKAIPHVTEIWPAPANHHQRWWKLQIRRFLERFL